MPKPAIILHETSLGENIGAVARAMGNFGLTDLRLSAPRKGWDKARAKAAARASTEILTKRKEYKDLRTALAPVDYVIASTARSRDLVKPVFSPAQMAEVLHQHRKKRCAILFGSEKMGLDNDAIALADAIVHIPAVRTGRSLNLAQAVVVLGYAWAQHSPQPMEAKSLPLKLASKGELQDFLAHLETALTASGYLLPKEKAPVMMRGLKNVFVRAQMSAQEMRSLRGALNALLLFPHKGKASKEAQALRAKIRKISSPKK